LRQDQGHFLAHQRLLQDQLFLGQHLLQLADPLGGGQALPARRPIGRGVMASSAPCKARSRS
jgi:hypothetical protein